MLTNPIEQSWFAWRRAFSELRAKLKSRSRRVLPAAATGIALTCGGERAIGPAFGVEVDAMPGLDQVPAEVGDVSFGAALCRVNSLKVQGQVHALPLPLRRIDPVIRHSPIIVLSHRGGSGWRDSPECPSPALPPFAIVPR